MDIPTTNVIRHWSAWGVSEDCPDKYIDYDPVRVRQFEAWLQQVKAEAWTEGWRTGISEPFGSYNPYIPENRNDKKSVSELRN
jgi:hypothetical protein